MNIIKSNLDFKTCIDELYTKSNSVFGKKFISYEGKNSWSLVELSLSERIKRWLNGNRDQLSKENLSLGLYNELIKDSNVDQQIKVLKDAKIQQFLIKIFNDKEGKSLQVLIKHKEEILEQIRIKNLEIAYSEKRKEQANALLQQHKENADSEFVSDEIIQKLEEFQVDIPSDSPFNIANTDLIVFDDSKPNFPDFWKKRLPINGILLSNLKKMEELYKKIDEGKAMIEIDPRFATVVNHREFSCESEIDPNFKPKILGWILKLMTRPLGRALLLQLESEKGKCYKKLVVSPTRGEESECVPDRIVNIVIGADIQADILRYHPTKKIIPSETEGYIGFAHELTHCLAPDWRRKATYSELYGYSVEKEIIQGKYEPKAEKSLSWNELCGLSESELEADLNQNANTLLLTNGDEITEWSVAAEFADSTKLFFPRYGHGGIEKCPQKRDFPDRKQYLTKLNDHFAGVIHFDLWHEIEGAGIDKLEDLFEIAAANVFKNLKNLERLATAKQDDLKSLVDETNNHELLKELHRNPEGVKKTLKDNSNSNIKNYLSAMIHLLEHGKISGSDSFTLILNYLQSKFTQFDKYLIAIIEIINYSTKRDYSNASDARHQFSSFRRSNKKDITEAALLLMQHKKLPNLTAIIKHRFLFYNNAVIVINAADKDGNTLLHHIAMLIKQSKNAEDIAFNKEIYKSLIERGSNRNLRNKANQLAIDLIC